MQIQALIYLFLLSCCWGPSFLFIKLATEEMHPITMVLFRVGLAGLFLLLILKSKKGKLFPYKGVGKRFACHGLFSSALPFLLIGYGETYIPSSLAGIINGSVPLFTAIIAYFYLQEPLSLEKVVGIILGFLGIFIIFFPTFSQESYTNFIGILLVILASLCYAIGIVYAKKHLSNLPFCVAPTGQFLFSTFYILPIWYAVLDPKTSLFFSHLGWISVLELAIIGSGIAFILYFHLCKIVDSTYVSTVTLLSPVIAILFGYIFLKETLSLFFNYRLHLDLSWPWHHEWVPSSSKQNQNKIDCKHLFSEIATQELSI